MSSKKCALFSVFSEFVDNGYVRALESRGFELFWHHAIPTEDIDGCRFSFSSKRKPLLTDHFLHYSIEEGLVYLEDYGRVWFLTVGSRPCWDGISETHSVMADGGKYSTSLFLKNSSVINSPKVDVTVYKSKYISQDQCFLMLQNVYRQT